MSQVSEVNEYILQSTPPPPHHFQHMMLCLTKKLVNFNFRWIFEICRWKKNQIKIFLNWCQIWVGQCPPPPPPPQNWKKIFKKWNFCFGIHSTSDDWPRDPGNESQPKCEKSPPKSLKNEMLVFGLGSTSDDRPSDLSKKIWSKCEKMKKLDLKTR